MAKYVTKDYGDGRSGVHTDHSAEIAVLYQSPVTAHQAAAALLECHDDTGISLDDWGPVRQLVEEALEGPILENHV